MRNTNDEDFDKINSKKCGLQSFWYGSWGLWQNWFANLGIQMMRTLTKLMVKNVDFKAFNMDDENFEKN